MFGHDNNHQNNSNGDTSGSDATVIAADSGASPASEDTSSAGSFVATPTTSDAAATAVVPANPATDDLLDIKHEALQALTPLVGQLEQTPEEQFRTTMMMIQASDNHALVKVAYEAAQKISNEKERAQALLDIVNEINYFTQQA